MVFRFIRNAWNCVRELVVSRAQPLPVPAKQYSHFLECDQLSPEFAARPSSAVRSADDELVTAVSGPADAVESLPPEARSWAAVSGVLSKSSVLGPRSPHTVCQEKEYIAQHTRWLARSKKYDDIYAEAQEWFSTLVNDKDISAVRAEADLSSLSGILTHAGRFALTFKRESSGKRLLDIGVVRYPDPETPYVKIYRIELFAWYESTTVLGRTIDRNGINARFEMQEFKPKDRAIKPRQGSAMTLALASEADSLFT